MSLEEDPHYCWSHHVVEKPSYLRCGECLHWFPDEATLVSDFNDSMAKVGDYPPTTADKIFFCPHCAHDF